MHCWWGFTLHAKIETETNYLLTIKSFLRNVLIYLKCNSNLELLRFCLKRNVGNFWNWMILDPTSSVPTKDRRLLWAWAGLPLTCDPIYSALYSASACCTPCILLNFINIITPECSQKPFDIITLDHLYHNTTNITSPCMQIHCVTITSLYMRLNFI